MSRSYKKNAYNKGCPCCHELKKNWFKDSKKLLRQHEEDIPNGKFYKRIRTCETWEVGLKKYVPKGKYLGYYSYIGTEVDEQEWNKHYKRK